MPEQLTFHQVARDRGTINAQHRAVAARAVAVQRPRDQFFTGPAFTANEDTTGCLRHAFYFRLQLQHLCAFAFEFVKGRRFLNQAILFGRQRCHPMRPVQRADHDVGHRDGQFEVTFGKGFFFAVQVNRAFDLVVRNQWHAN